MRNTKKTAGLLREDEDIRWVIEVGEELVVLDPQSGESHAAVNLHAGVVVCIEKHGHEKGTGDAF